MEDQAAAGAPERAKLRREWVAAIQLGVEETNGEVIADELRQLLIDERLGVDGEAPAGRGEDARTAGAKQRTERRSA